MIKEKAEMCTILKGCRLSIVLFIPQIAIIFYQVRLYFNIGSQDMNIRLWKSQASKPIGVVNEREKRSLEYR